MADETAIICMRVQNLPIPPVPCVVAQCSECGVDVWVSEAMVLAYPDVAPNCLKCALPKIQSPDAEFPQADHPMEENDHVVPALVEAMRNGLLKPEDW